MLYLDTSAVVKLIRREPLTDALADWLDDHQPTPWVSSTLVEVELTRVPAVIARYDIDDVVRAAAAAFPDPDLRSLDAIHLATATAIFARRLTAFVCYDQRLLDAATAAGVAGPEPGHRVTVRRRHAALVLPWRAGRRTGWRRSTSPVLTRSPRYRPPISSTTSPEAPVVPGCIARGSGVRSRHRRWR
jgi:uncharacterized protein